MLNALAELASRSPRKIVVVAVLAAAVAGALGSGVAKRLDPYGADDPATESVQADTRLHDAGFRDLSVIVLVREVRMSSRAGKRRVRAIEARVAKNRDVAKVASFYDTGARAFVSNDGRSTYLTVALKPTGDKAREDAARRIASSLADAPGVVLGGPSLTSYQANKQAQEDLRRAEAIAFPIVFLLSLLFFRGAVAAALPPLIGGLSLVGTLLVLRVASELTSVSVFALNLVAGLGMGLAIDYSLFMVSRYREEMARSGPGLAAMRRTMASAGRTIFFSALTVATALASLLVFPQRFLFGMGIGGSCVAILAGALALVVLPAVLILLGHRVNGGAPAWLQRRAGGDARPPPAGVWYRPSRLLVRPPPPNAGVGPPPPVPPRPPLLHPQV